MKPLRCLAVAATVLTVIPAGCGDDEMGGGFSSMPNSAGSESMTDSSGAATMLPPTSSASSSGSASAEGEDSTSEGNSTGGVSTSGSTGVGETGPESTTQDPTNNTTNPGMCGNGSLDANEQCDGGNLNGFTCESLGNTGGTLLCDPVTCTFDTAMCTNDTSGGTSG